MCTTQECHQMKHMIFVTLSLFSYAVFGHHGIANFNHNKDVDISGAVTRFAFVNPHSWLYLDVTDSKGQVTPWRCELRAATVLRRSGWSKEIFKVGMDVTITGAPERRQANTCYTNTITLSDGTRLDRYGQISQEQPSEKNNSSEKMANGDPNINGDWAAEQFVLSDPKGQSGAFLPLSVAQQLKPGEIPEGSQAFPGTRGTPKSLIEGPLDGPGNFPEPVIPTDLGKKMAMRSDGKTVGDRLLTCQPINILSDLGFEGHVNRVIQSSDEIEILYGFMDIKRTIYMGMEQHPVDLVPDFTGHSIGKWVNGTLYVDTIGFTPGRIARTSNLMYSGELHVREKFDFDPDTMTLKREFTAVDALYFHGEFIGTDTLQAADVPYQPYDCNDLTLGE